MNDERCEACEALHADVMPTTCHTCGDPKPQNRPQYLVEPPSITEQTDWPCGFYDLPDKFGGLSCVHFNCAIVNWCGRNWLITRTMTQPSRHRYLSRIVFWPLTDNRPGDRALIHMDNCYPDQQAEDPRAFVDGYGRCWLAWAAWRYARPGLYAHQVLGYVDEGFRVPLPMHVAYGKNGDHIHRNRGSEKNWVWFVDEAGLHFAYTMQPHVVCDVENGAVIHQHSTAGDQAVWKYGEQRGGTPPIRVGDEYFAFFHSSQRWYDPFRRYFMGAYAFSVKPPYAVTRMTRYPILFASQDDPRVGPSPIVVFPCGALFCMDDYAQRLAWTVTFGVNDCRCAWIKIPHAELLERLVRL